LTETECEYPAVHSFFCHIPQNLPFEQLIPNAVQCFEAFPPTKLLKVARVQRSIISSYPFKWMEEEMHPDIIFSKRKSKVKSPKTKRRVRTKARTQSEKSTTTQKIALISLSLLLIALMIIAFRN